jgi:hypothetical protein
MANTKSSNSLRDRYEAAAEEARSIRAMVDLLAMHFAAEGAVVLEDGNACTYLMTVLEHVKSLQKKIDDLHEAAIA